jgi:hypothetical protein
MGEAGALICLSCAGWAGDGGARVRRGAAAGAALPALQPRPEPLPAGARHAACQQVLQAPSTVLGPAPEHGIQLASMVNSRHQ